MSENPYESPNSPNGAPQSRGWSAGRIVYFIFILILAIPASLIAAMTLCFVTGGITKPTNIVSHATKINIGLMVGAITAVLTFILIFRSAIKRLGPRKSGDPEQAREEVGSRWQNPADTNQDE